MSSTASSEQSEPLDRIIEMLEELGNMGQTDEHKSFKTIHEVLAQWIASKPNPALTTAQQTGLDDLWSEYFKPAAGKDVSHITCSEPPSAI